MGCPHVGAPAHRAGAPPHRAGERHTRKGLVFGPKKKSPAGPFFAGKWPPLGSHVRGGLPLEGPTPRTWAQTISEAGPGSFQGGPRTRGRHPVGVGQCGAPFFGGPRGTSRDLLRSSPFRCRNVMPPRGGSGPGSGGAGAPTQRAAHSKRARFRPKKRSPAGPFSRSRGHRSAHTCVGALPLKGPALARGPERFPKRGPVLFRGSQERGGGSRAGWVGRGPHFWAVPGAQLGTCCEVPQSGAGV